MFVRLCAGVREMVLRSATGCESISSVHCGLRVNLSALAVAAEQQQIPLLVAPASNQLLLIVKKSMGEESQCALTATANGSITACC